LHYFYNMDMLKTESQNLHGGRPHNQTHLSDTCSAFVRNHVDHTRHLGVRNRDHALNPPTGPTAISIRDTSGYRFRAFIPPRTPPRLCPTHTKLELEWPPMRPCPLPSPAHNNRRLHPEPEENILGLV